MSIVHIQKQDNEWANSNAYIAMMGFWEKGYDVRGFDILNASPDGITKQTPVVAGVSYVRRIIESLIGEAPPLLDYPEVIRDYCGRNIWKTTLGEVRENPNRGIFIKPLNDGKAFTGYCVREFADLIPTSGYPDDYELWASDILPFTSEWRVYVLNGEILHVGFYGQGNPTDFPHPAVIHECIEEYEEYNDAPIAYGLDFGVTEDKATVLVEANDAYALGNYGMPAVKYATLLEARWQELMQ